MGITALEPQGARQAIPPAYTEWIGAALLTHLTMTGA